MDLGCSAQRIALSVGRTVCLCLVGPGHVALPKPVSEDKVCGERVFQNPLPLDSLTKH